MSSQKAHWISRKGGNLDSSFEVKQQWEEIKSGERADKGQNSLMDDIPLAFPSLLRAQKLQKRAAKAGFDWPDCEGVFDKLQEEIAEVQEAIENSPNRTNSSQPDTEQFNSSQTVSRSTDEAIEEELGALLFTCVNLVRKLGYDSETTLRKASSKFEKRFRNMEKKASLSGLNTAELESLWDEVKEQAQ